MKISSRSRYGLRFMVYLGTQYGNGAVNLQEIAENEAISIKYLEQIAHYLKSANLIISQRGTGGGYQLKEAPEKTNLKDIITPLEGDIKLVNCDNNENCERRNICVTADIWHELGELITNYFENTKLSDLVEACKIKNNANLMYYI